MTPAGELPERLGISRERCGEIVVACSHRVVSYELEDIINAEACSEAPTENPYR